MTNRPQAVRFQRIPYRVDRQIFIGGHPRPPFWRRRVPWFEVLLFLLLIAALVAAVHAAGGRFEIGQ